MERFLFFFISILQGIALGVVDREPGHCPLWLAVQSAEPPALSWSELLVVTKYYAEKETAEFYQVHHLAQKYREAYHDSLNRFRAGRDFGEAEMLAAAEAERALDRMILALADELGDNGQAFIENYLGGNFGINRQVTGRKIEKLEAAVAIQAYLAHHHRVMMNLLVAGAGVSPADVTDNDLARASSAAASVLSRPSIELEFLRRIDRWSELASFTIEETVDGPTVVSRAALAEVKGALGKADGIAKQPGLPHVVRDYLAAYGMLRKTMPRIPAHPLLVDLVGHASALVP